MAGQKFTLTFDAQLNVSQMKGALAEIQANLNKLQMPASATKGLTDTFTKLKEAVKDFEETSNKPVKNQGDINKIENSASKVFQLFDSLKKQLNDLGSLSGKNLEKLFPTDVATNIEVARKALADYEKQIKTTQSKIDSINKSLKTQEVIIAQESARKTSAIEAQPQVQADIAAASQAVMNRAHIDDVTAAVQKLNDEYAKLAEKVQSLQGKEILTPAEKGTITKANNIKTLIDNYNNAQNAAKTTEAAIAEADQKIKTAKDNIKDLNDSLAVAETLHTENVNNALEQLWNNLNQINGIDLSGYEKSFENAKKAVEDFVNKNGAASIGQIQNFVKALESSGVNADDLKAKIAALRVEEQRMNDQMRDISTLKSRIQYFFGLSNAINLAKRAIRDAFTTIKDLDKAMTETAVVTNFSVSDMWSQLPAYTKQANELGVTTLEAYQAATLYYQQGLKTNEVNALSTETLKMARIAGLEAAEATDRMTNALRGFNMELTAANAQRVDDVYSELAANTASNVDEISTAMTKVASLANNANMEFETTAAFLAQIIETTRESAETAGTALKTVVARFSEVKKLVDEGTLRGQDEEGEIIDVNKVGQALRTAGIDLNKYFLGEVGLDDIFMELASKWDSLTSLQQRYIATQAAGSRQQSRFIAMMSNYARTQELVGKAYTSTGAAARQFEKTQESLQSKLARLKNAWDEFLMGLSNSTIVKGAVDLLTGLLNVVNSLTGAFGDGAGFVLKWITAIAAFGGIKALFKSGGLVDKGLMALLSGTGIGNTLTKAGIIGGTTGNVGGVGLFSKIQSISGSVASFKKGAIDPTWYLNPNVQSAHQNYLNLRHNSPNDLAAIAAARNEYIRQKGLAGGNGATTLFGALGNKFISTKLGGKISTGLGAALGKVGIGSGAALSGAATLATTIAGVAAAAGVAYVAIKKMYDASPAGQLKAAQKYAEELQNISDEAKKTANSFKDVNTEYKQYTDAVKSAKTGEELNTALNNRNEYLSQLLKDNPEYAQYIQSSNEGLKIVLTIDEEAFSKAMDTAISKAAEASGMAYLGEAAVAGREANVSEYQARKLEGNQIRQEMAAAELGVVAASTEAYNTALADLGAQAQLKNDEQLTKAILGYQQIIQSLEGQGAERLGYFKNENYANLISKALGAAFDEETWKDINQTDLVKSIIENVTSTQVGSAENYTQVLKALSGDIFKDSNIELDLENSEFATQLTNFANALGLDVEQLKKHIQLQSELNTQLKANKRADIYTKLFKGGVGVSQDLDQYLSSKTLNELLDIESFTSSIEEALGMVQFDEFLQNANLSFEQFLQSVEFPDIKDFFGELNFDQPVQALDQINNKLTQVGNNPIFSNLLKEVISVNSELFKSNGLVQGFLMSKDYDGLKDSLEQFIKANESITADNINELAEGCANLRLLLDQDSISAEALATVFTQYEQGKLGIDSISEALLRAYSSGETLEETLISLHDWMSNFDRGLDFTQASTFFGDLADDALGFIDNLQLGQDELIHIYDAIVAPPKEVREQYTSAYDVLLDEVNDDLDELSAKAEENLKKAKKAIENDSLGFMQDFSGNTTLGITKTGKNKFNWDDAGRTTQELISDIQDQWSLTKGFDITEEFAQGLLEGWLAHAPEMRRKLKDNDINKGLDEFIEGLGDRKFVGEGELQALADKLGLTIDELRKRLQKKAEEKGVTIPIEVGVKGGSPDKAWSTYIQGLVGKGGIRSEDAESHLRNLFSEYASTGTTNTGEEVTYIDYDKLMSDLQGQGFTEAESGAIAEQMSKFMGLQLGKAVQQAIDNGAEGGEIEFEPRIELGDSINELTANVNAALEAANYSLVAEKLANLGFDGLSNAASSAVSDGILSGAQSGITAASKYAQENPISGDINFDSNYLDFIAAIQKYLDEHPFKAKTDVSTEGGSYTGGRVGSKASNIKVPSYAKGSENYMKYPGFSLTGEEGPEIVWNKESGYAYITGQDGPEFQNLVAGDRIFNADETKHILSNSNRKKEIFESNANGGYNWGRGGSSGSGSGKDKKGDDWSNELDWLYNLLNDIAEFERQQAMYAAKFEAALKDTSKTGRDLYNLTQQQLGKLISQRVGYEAQLEQREKELAQLEKDASKEKIGGKKGATFDKYARYNEQDNTVEIDWDKINKIKDKDQYDAVVEYIEKLENAKQSRDEAEQALLDIDSQIEELQQQYLSKYLDFEKRVMDAVVAQYQENIDKLSELNDTINSTNADIISSMQEQINLERQIRDNTQKEQDISDMEAQLAFLQRDTSGANQTAILDLQEKLRDAQQDYSDTLLDQSIDQLSKSNEEAQKQREKQIEIMQSQLDYMQKNGLLWDEVHELIAGGFTDSGSIKEGSDLYKLLQDADAWNGMSQAQRLSWADDLILETNQVGAYLLQELNGAQLTQSNIEKILGYMADATQYIAPLDYQDPASLSGPDKWRIRERAPGGKEGAYTWTQGQKDKYRQYSLTPEAIHYTDEPQPTPGSKPPTSTPTPTPPSTLTSVLTSFIGGQTVEIKKKTDANTLIRNDDFLKLANVVPNWTNAVSKSTTTTNAPVTFNLDVQVDQLANDYDVDELVSRLKEDLYNSAMYKNGNVLSLLR